MLLSNSSNDGSRFDVHPSHIHHDVGVWITELSLVDSPHSEHDFIQVDDCSILSLCSCE